ncbi:hypothetical protein [Pseudoduganella sp. R-34]|uniref:hypothetical protein n=1 Tax=Pseudoduganella sp. R-34 TaxID=3404062 RepID=UPI003CEAB4B3
MNQYRLSEMALFAAPPTTVMLLFAPTGWAIGAFLVMVVGQALLERLSVTAFIKAKELGFLAQSTARQQRVFFIKPECPSKWLVRRHIRAHW